MPQSAGKIIRNPEVETLVSSSPTWCPSLFGARVIALLKITWVTPLVRCRYRWRQRTGHKGCSCLWHNRCCECRAVNR